jgi:hypothetical protein
VSSQLDFQHAQHEYDAAVFIFVVLTLSAPIASLSSAAQTDESTPPLSRHSTLLSAPTVARISAMAVSSRDCSVNVRGILQTRSRKLVKSTFPSGVRSTSG